MFTCGECHEVTNLEGFLSNITLTDPIACVMCGNEIDTWDFACRSCDQEYSEDAWAEYIAFMFDIGEYAYAEESTDAFVILQTNIINGQDVSYRKNYEAYIESISDLCFMCGAGIDDCLCHPKDAFYLNEFLFMPDNIKDAFFYQSALLLPNSKYAQSCYNCTKQYTLRCNKLPEQLLTIGLNHQPAYKLDTCEYIETSVNIYAGELPDDGAPF